MKPNREVCAEFRELLTKGVYFVNNDGELYNERATAVRLAETKPWRNELWKAFREIEDRLCPVEADMRKKREAHEQGNQSD